MMMAPNTDRLNTTWFDPIFVMSNGGGGIALCRKLLLTRSLTVGANVAHETASTTAGWVRQRC